MRNLNPERRVSIFYRLHEGSTLNFLFNFAKNKYKTYFLNQIIETSDLMLADT